MGYTGHQKHYVALDIIIFGFDRQGLKLLCIRRSFAPEKGKWSLMGGFLKAGESLDNAAKRILFALTGLKNIYLEQLMAYGEPDRDPADRVISIAYFALINSRSADTMIPCEHEARWFEIGSLPELVFDHNDMVEKALKRLQRRCRTQPVGFELLPEQFTLPQLLALYEAIFMKAFDKRNFRKKMLSLGILRRLEIKDREGSRKGAYLYEFEEAKYSEMVNKGINFEI